MRSHPDLVLSPPEITAGELVIDELSRDLLRSREAT